MNDHHFYEPKTTSDLSAIPNFLRGVIHRDELGVINAPMRKFCEFDDGITRDLKDLVHAIDIMDYVQCESHKDNKLLTDKIAYDFDDVMCDGDPSPPE